MHELKPKNAENQEIKGILDISRVYSTLFLNGNKMRTTREIDQIDSNEEVVSRFFEEYELNSEKRNVNESTITEIRTICNYTQNIRKLRCIGPLGVVECEVTPKLGDLDNSFKYFSIEKPDFESEQILKMMLYPRTLGKTNWLNHTILLRDNQYVTYSLHYSDEINDYGFKFQESCFQQLVKFFKNSKYTSSINLIKNNNILSEFNTQSIPIVGNIIFIE